VGNFGQWEATQVYLTVRKDLMKVYMGAAFEPQSKVLYEKALYHALEIQRLDSHKSSEVRYMTPFMLVNLHRDDDAFDFIRCWLNTDLSRQLDRVAVAMRHFASKEGDWIYPREKNCRFLDIFDECPDVDNRDAPLSFLMALLIIKLRIVATYDATHRSIALAFDTTGGERIQEVQESVQEWLVDERLVNIDRQRQQVERLLDVIHRNNPLMLPAFLNPIPYLEPDSKSLQGHSAEVSKSLIYCLRTFLRVPGVEAMLKQRFGK
jgi:hypothetical protein